MTVSTVPVSVQRARLLKEVPPFRPVAVQILNLVSDVSQPLARVVNLLRTDAVLTAEVLRLANSPLLGCRSEIKNILQALAFLGTDRINSLIVTTAMRGLAGPASANLARACWRHNLATAVIAERLGPSVRVNAERGYMCGLIHDIGRLALLRAFPNYEQALTEAAAEGRNMLAMEKGLYGMDHTDAGRWLLAQWGCPREFQIVAAQHENPTAAAGRDRDLVFLVAASSQLADLVEFCEFPELPKVELKKVMEMIPEAGSHLSDIPALSEFVATRVNGIELSLG
ncbi:MAG TPA: HDOD domain-containing protein [Verrucomicrobiae bacterium]|nr:HDOD domain-containing protein [Verrucomicrobiae bacterium]